VAGMKKTLIIIAVLALAGTGWWGFRRTGSANGSAPGPTATGKVERRTIEVQVEVVGEINPANQVTVKSEVSGRIQQIDVATGQEVRKGEPLLSLDDRDLVTERDAAQTQITGAKVQLEKAQRDLDRLAELLKSALVSQEVYDNARTALELARNDYELAQRRLQSVEDKLKKIRIDAPFDGTVLSVAVSKGQVVSGAAGVNAGTELMTFANLDQMLIRAHVNQVDVTRLERGQQARITIDSLAGVEITGAITLIAPVATVKSDVKGFDVDVLVARSDPRIRPGMNANLKFPVAKLENALTVPLAAVFSEGTNKVVYVRLADGRSERRVVKLGANDYRHTAVTDGLHEGETVLLERPDDKA
jgi:RND family efflux transporter MFP subunit